MTRVNQAILVVWRNFVVQRFFSKDESVRVDRLIDLVTRCHHFDTDAWNAASGLKAARFTARCAAHAVLATHKGAGEIVFHARPVDMKFSLRCLS